MSALHPGSPLGAPNRSATVTAGVARPIDAAGVYLTDEVFLYRVVGPIADDRGEMVELEDCYGLDVVRVPADHLRARRLRAVTPAAGSGKSGPRPFAGQRLSGPRRLNTRPGS